MGWWACVQGWCAASWHISLSITHASNVVSEQFPALAYLPRPLHGASCTLSGSRQQGGDT